MQEGIVMRHASHCALLDGKIRPWLTERMLDIGGSREQVEGEIRALEAAHQQQLAELKAQRESRHRWSPLRMVDRAREAGTSLIGIEGQASELRARYAESVCPGLKDLSTAERLALLWIMSSVALGSARELRGSEAAACLRG